MLSNCIKDSENIAISEKEKFTKNMDRKRVAREMTRCVLFPDQDNELVQHIKVHRKQGFCLSVRWVRVTMIQLIRKDL